MSISRSREPANLGRLAGIDPLKLEPGVIIWDRFCVVGKVRHASPLWSVPVTDLHREFGRAPTHGVSLQYLPIPEQQRARIHKAVAADEEVQPQVRATIELPRGMALIHEPVTGERLGAQLPGRESRALALSLTSLLSRLHEAGVRGIGLRGSALRQSEGRFRLDGFAHLYGAGTVEQDLEGLVGLLRRFSGQHIGGLLDPAPSSATELWTRTRTLAQEHGATATPLSQHPPFVGREDARRELEKAYSHAQIARSSLILVCGEQGVGKSRLLEEFASWLRANERAVVVRGEYLRGCGESRAGLLGALAQLPRGLASWPEELRDRARERMLRRTGSLVGVLASYAPELAEFLEVDAENEGGRDDVPNLEFEEGIARHAVAVAEGVRAVGTQTHPLVILLDNLQLADRGSVAILRRLLLEDRAHHTMIVAGLCGAAPAGLAEAPDEGSWNPRRDPQLLLRRIELEAMDAAELERLIVAGLPGPVGEPGELAEVLHETSGGSPLVAWATLQAWIDSGTLVRNEAEPWALQRRRAAVRSPRAVFAQRVEQTSLDERWLALLAAIAGGHVDEAWFQRVSSWTPERVTSAVTGLERQGLMGKAGEASLRFPHELVRELMLESMAAEEHRRAHAKIAGWLASLGPRVSPARLAYHTDRALGQASSSESELVEMHLAAGREMLGVFDLERSGWHFTRALVERNKGGSRLAAIEGAADVALLGEKYDEAAQFYAEAVLEAEDGLYASRIAAKAVHGLFRKGAATEAMSIGRLALARADRPLPEPGLRLRTAKFEAKLRLAMRREPSHEFGAPLREQLCWLYARMAAVLELNDPRSAELCLLRGLRHARGLRRAAASDLFARYGVLLCAQGKDEDGRRYIEQAIELAVDVGNDWTLALAQHLRGHRVELPRGDHRQGLASLDQAVAHFRRTGDLSVAVSSLLFKAVYSRDRVAIPVLHGWLDEAAALNEVQGDGLVDLAIDALRLLLRARAGARNIGEAVTSVAARVTQRELVSYEGYLPYAYLALALLEVGEQGIGRELIELALERAHEHPLMPDYAYELWAARATLLARSRASADLRRLDETLRVLERAGRSSPRLRAQAQVARMRQLLSAGERDEAQRVAEGLASSLPAHGQTYLALEAHQTLGELLRGTDVLAAREHVHLARGLAEELGLDRARERERERESAAEQADIPRPRPRDRSSRRHSNAYLRALARNELVSVAGVLEGSRQVLLETLNVPWLYLRAQPQLRVFGELLELQSLLVHLALCGRDSVEAPEQLRAVGTLVELDPTRAAKIPGGSAGPWGCIAVSVVGSPTSVGGGVSACRQVATRLGGFLEVEQSEEILTLAVYLPPERGSKPAATITIDDSDDYEDETLRYEGVYVLHPDPIIRETLTSAVSRLGHACQDAAPDDIDFRDLPSVQVLFADADTLANYAAQFPHVPRIVELGSRIVRPNSKYPALRVPFALGELRKLLDVDSQS